jgi:hypothetical protein
MAEVIGLERALLRPGVRSSAEAVSRLLDPEFREIGASGRLWNRAEMISEMVAGARNDPAPAVDSDMDGRRLAPDLILLTYLSDAAGRQARRTSLWRRREGHWRVLHHQGTLLL